MRRGSRIGKYRLERRIGSGSFAEVWKARDVIEQRDVALKIAAAPLVAAYGRDEIEREARIASRLTHPNIVFVRNADWIEGRFVIATDLAERNLAEYAGARRSQAVALRVIENVAAGLAYAHRRRLMHRDLKPENILIFRDRRAALADFGVAKFARGPESGFTEAGTLGYMAPEQAYGRPRFASDVFSLGLIAYELLSGVLPSWPFEWPLEGHGRLVKRVPEGVARVLQRAIRLDAKRRHPDAGAFHREWVRALEKANEKPARRSRRRATTSEATPFEVEARLFLRRHRRALDLRGDCLRCGGPISEPMAYCPWCGSAENSFRELTNYPLVCPECERGVRPEWTSCPWCHRGRFEGNGRKPRVDVLAERHCSRRGCDGELRPFMRYCPRCKTKTKRPWSHPDLPNRCRRCRWPTNDLFWRFCPWCGARSSRSNLPTAARRRS